MKVQPIAVNHIHLILDNGDIIDVNDGSSTKEGYLTLRLGYPTDEHKFMIVKENREDYIKIITKEL